MPGMYDAPHLTAALLCLLLGLFWGAAYDVFRIRRLASASDVRAETAPEPEKQIKKTVPVFLTADPFREGRAGKLAAGLRRGLKTAETALIFLEDVTFFAFAAVTLILLTYVECRGIIRGYTVLCAAGGFVLYYLTVGRITRKFAATIIGIVRGFLRFVMKFTLFPVLNLLRLLIAAAEKTAEKTFRRAVTRAGVRKMMKFAENGLIAEKHAAGTGIPKVEKNRLEKDAKNKGERRHRRHS